MATKQANRVSIVRYEDLSRYGESAWHVFVNGERAGYVAKHRDTRTTRHPWRAYGKPIQDRANVLPSYFPHEWDDAKAKAVAEVVADFIRKPVDLARPEAAAFVAAIKAAPTCETARLVFADWCDENGYESAGAWLRLDVEMAFETMPDPRLMNEWQRGSRRYFGGEVEMLYYAVRTQPKANLSAMVAAMAD